MSTTTKPRIVVENTGTGRGTASPGYFATILVSDPIHLCSAQWATREICRSLGFDEAAVYRAVIAVTEFAQKELIDPGRGGKLHLTAVQTRGRLALEARTELELGASYA